MKKLILLIALFGFICYVGSAYSMTQEEWKACANAELQAADDRFKSREAILKEVCEFYGKPLDECAATYDASSAEQQTQIMQDFVIRGILIPKCGNPNEAK